MEGLGVIAVETAHFDEIASSQCERALKRIEDGIKQGLVGGLLVLDRDGQAHLT